MDHLLSATMEEGMVEEFAEISEFVHQPVEGYEDKEGNSSNQIGNSGNTDKEQGGKGDGDSLDNALSQGPSETKLHSCYKYEKTFAIERNLKRHEQLHGKGSIVTQLLHNLISVNDTGESADPQSVKNPLDNNVSKDLDNIFSLAKQLGNTGSLNMADQCVSKEDLFGNRSNGSFINTNGSYLGENNFKEPLSNCEDMEEDDSKDDFLKEREELSNCLADPDSFEEPSVQSVSKQAAHQPYTPHIPLVTQSLLEPGAPIQDSGELEELKNKGHNRDFITDHDKKPADPGGEDKKDIPADSDDQSSEKSSDGSSSQQETLHKHGIKEESKDLTDSSEHCMVESVPDIKYFKAEETISCSECGHVCSSYEDLKRHMANHNSFGDISSFDGKQMLDGIKEEVKDLDFMLNSGAKSVPCPECGQNYNDSKSLKIHIGNYHTPGEFPCDQCEIVFHLKGRLKSHKQNTHRRKGKNAVVSDSAGLKEKTELCPICGQAYKNSSLLKKHIANYHVVGEFCCDKCGVEFNLKGKLKSHRLEKHRIEDEETTPATCSDCGQSYKTSYRLKIHVSNYHSPGEFPCDQCGDMFDLKGRLKSHKLDKHRSEEEEEGASGDCPDCGQNYKSSYRLKIHITNYHTPGEYTCDKCGDVFDLKGRLKSHKLDFHTLNEEYKTRADCPECGQNFKSSYRLKIHITNYHVAGEFPCNQCGDVFNLKGKLKSHKLDNHSASSLEDKNKICPYCSKECRSIRHHIRRVHSAEENMKTELCTDCGKEFSNKSYLWAHINTVHVEDIRHCEFCGKSYGNQMKLNNHLKMVHRGGPDEETNIPCDKCGRKFLTQKRLQEHMKVNHTYGEFICKKCGEKFDLKVKYRGHLRFAHKGPVL